MYQKRGKQRPTTNNPIFANLVDFIVCVSLDEKDEKTQTLKEFRFLVNSHFYRVTKIDISNFVTSLVALDFQISFKRYCRIDFEKN